MARGRRTRHELRDGQAAEIARKDRLAAIRLLSTWGSLKAAQGALESIRQCDSVWPSSVADVAPVVCDRLEEHPPGEDDGGHRHRIQGSQVVVTW